MGPSHLLQGVFLMLMIAIKVDCKDTSETQETQEFKYEPPLEPKDDSVVLITGGIHGTIFRTVEVLDLYNRSCHPKFAPLPFNTKFGHTSHFIPPHNVFLVGGHTNMLGKQCLLMENNGQELQFGPYNSLRTPRSFHTGVEVGKKIWIFGGEKAENETETLDGDNLKEGWKEQQVEAGNKFKCSVAIDEKVVVDTGGQNEGSTKGVRRLDTGTGIWTEMEPMGTSRMKHGCAFLKESGVVLVAGGQETAAGKNDAYLKSAEIYHVEEGKWERVGDLEEGRSYGQLVVVGGRALYIGGMRGWGKERLDVVEEYIPEKKEWRKLEVRLERGRDVGFSAVVVPGRVLGCGACVLEGRIEVWAALAVTGIIMSKMV